MESIAAERKHWTVLSLLDWSARNLSERKFESPRLTVELLLSSVLGCRRIDLYTNFDKPLSPDEMARFKAYFKRKRDHEPLQYILGECEFMGLRFQVDRRVLIPRPETEVLVERVVKLAEQSSSPPTTILDIGTGCGNIAISLARFLPGVTVDATEVNDEALEVARANVQRNGVGEQVRLIRADFLSHDEAGSGPRYDFVVSNPPYVSKEEFRLLPPEVSDFEPAVALTDRADGLTFFKAMAEKGKSLLRNGGCVVVEMGYDQSAAVRDVFGKAGYRDMEITIDYSGIERVFAARWGQ